MAITAKVVDGELSYDYTNSADKKLNVGSSNLGYDQFLQLLCAEMQYQDPLEPTSNTDYIAQLATFSQLESTLSMQEAVDAVGNSQKLDFASSLVGKEVLVVDPKSATGYADGVVDYAMQDDQGKVFISVNDKLYSIDDLDTVANDEYYEAIVSAKSISNMIKDLPKYEELTTSYKTAIEQIRNLYDGLTSYQQGFVSKDDLSKLKKYESKIAELEAAAKKEAEEAEEAEDTEKTEETDDTEKVEDKE